VDFESDDGFESDEVDELDDADDSELDDETVEELPERESVR
jgi:hypothetical protein